MTSGSPGQHEFDDLSALLDGELPPERAAEIEALVRSDQRWRAAWLELKAVDAALDDYPVPAAPADLAGRIVAAARRLRRSRPIVIRIARWAAPLAAAAAAVILAVALISRTPQDPVSGTTIAKDSPKADPLKGLDGEDRFVVANLSFFKDIGVLENLETLNAIERLEGP